MNRKKPFFRTNRTKIEQRKHTRNDTVFDCLFEIVCVEYNKS